MKLYDLSEDINQAVVACVTFNNEVIWKHQEDITPETKALFIVWRTGDIVHAEALGWHTPNFHMRLSLNEHEPFKVVILAHETASLIDQARD